GRVARSFDDVAAKLGPIAEQLRSSATPAEVQLARAAAHDVAESRGASVVVAGARQPEVVHAIVHAIDELPGKMGQTGHYTPPAAFELGEASHGLDVLAAAIAAGQVDRLVSLGGNPVYSAPADLQLASLIEKVPLSAHLARYEDETGRVSKWVLPEAHYLETW